MTRVFQQGLSAAVYQQIQVGVVVAGLGSIGEYPRVDVANKQEWLANCGYEQVAGAGDMPGSVNQLGQDGIEMTVIVD